METSTTPLRSFLDATTLADMEELQQQELVSLCATDTIETGFQVPPFSPTRKWSPEGSH
jgi:hypothetical protein